MEKSSRRKELSFLDQETDCGLSRRLLPAFYIKANHYHILRHPSLLPSQVTYEPDFAIPFHHRSTQLQKHICAGPEEEEPVSEMRERTTWKERGREGRALGQLVEMPHDMAAVGTRRMCWQGCVRVTSILKPGMSQISARITRRAVWRVQMAQRGMDLQLRL